VIIEYFKYHGTGNDFIIIDDRDQSFPPEDRDVIRHLCARRFGVGADGLLLLQNSSGEESFRMIYFNSDGADSTFCGNGSRCLVHFAHRMGVFKEACTFMASDGLHQARMHSLGVSVRMQDVAAVERHETHSVLDTGSPHYVLSRATEDLDVVEEGRKIRYSRAFAQMGINVNFTEYRDGALSVRTYERGVEDETLSCGTGATASALVWALDHPEAEEITVRTLGGELQVNWKRVESGFSEIWLSGPAVMVSHGYVHI